MLYAAGAKFIIAARAEPDGVYVDGFAFICNLKPAVVEPVVLRAMDGKLPAKSVYLELICGTPRTGAATVILIHLMRKLSTKSVAGVLAHAVNKNSRTLPREARLLPSHGTSRHLLPVRRRRSPERRPVRSAPAPQRYRAGVVHADRAVAGHARPRLLGLRLTHHVLFVHLRVRAPIHGFWNPYHTCGEFAFSRYFRCFPCVCCVRFRYG